MQTMEKKENEAQSLTKNLEFAFLDTFSEAEMVIGVYLATKLLEHRANPVSRLDDTDTHNTPGSLEVARKIISEIEQVYGTSYRNLTDEVAGTAIVSCAEVESKIFTQKWDKEDPGWRLRAQENLQKLRSVNSNLS